MNYNPPSRINVLATPKVKPKQISVNIDIQNGQYMLRSAAPRKQWCLSRLSPERTDRSQDRTAIVQVEQITAIHKQERDQISQRYQIMKRQYETLSMDHQLLQQQQAEQEDRIFEMAQVIQSLTAQLVAAQSQQSQGNQLNTILQQIQTIKHEQTTQKQFSLKKQKLLTGLVIRNRKMPRSRSTDVVYVPKRTFIDIPSDKLEKLRRLVPMLCCVACGVIYNFDPFFSHDCYNQSITLNTPFKPQSSESNSIPKILNTIVRDTLIKPQVLHQIHSLVDKRLTERVTFQNLSLRSSSDSCNATGMEDSCEIRSHSSLKKSVIK